MAEKQALGMTMQVSQEFINNIAEELVRENLLKTLDGENKFFAALVHELMDTKVSPDNGRVTTYRDGIPYIQYLINETIRKELAETVKAMLDEKRPDIQKKIRAELMKKDTVSKFYEAFTDSVASSLSLPYYVHIDASFKKRSEF